MIKKTGAVVLPLFGIMTIGVLLFIMAFGAGMPSSSFNAQLSGEELAPAPSGSSNPGCPALRFFGVRGSGQTASSYNGYGQTIWSFKNALQALVPGLSATPVDYPAIRVQLDLLRIPNYSIAYEKSVEKGAQSLAKEYRDYETNCVDQPVIFAGYSQGADVAVRAFYALSGAEQAHVILVNFGDPHFNPAQPWVDRGNYNPKREASLVRFWGDAPHSFLPSDASHVHSWCASGDAVCNYNFNNGIGCLATVLFNHCLHEYVYTDYRYEAAWWARNALQELS